MCCIVFIIITPSSFSPSIVVCLYGRRSLVAMTIRRVDWILVFGPSSFGCFHEDQIVIDHVAVGGILVFRVPIVLVFFLFEQWRLLLFLLHEFHKDLQGVLGILHTQLRGGIPRPLGGMGTDQLHHEGIGNTASLLGLRLRLLLLTYLKALSLLFLQDGAPYHLSFGLVFLVGGNAAIGFVPSHTMFALVEASQIKVHFFEGLDKDFAFQFEIGQFLFL